MTGSPTASTTAVGEAYSKQHITRLQPEPLLFRKEGDVLISETNSDVVVIDCKCRIGEGVLWDDRTQSALWIDIEGRRLFCLSYASQLLETWHLQLLYPSIGRPGCIALCRSGRLLLACEDGFYFFSFDAHTITRAGPTADDMDSWQQKELTARGYDVRLNDGRVDASGKLVVGGINLTITPDAWDAVHPCYVVSKSLISQTKAPAGASGGEAVAHEVKVHLLEGYQPARITNGISFSFDNQWMYHTDTPTKEIRAFRYEQDSGRIQGAGHLLAKSDYSPDGSVIDSRGGMWNAEYEGGRVIRYLIDENRLNAAAAEHGVQSPFAHASLIVNVDFIKQTTCPCLGGPAGDLLFVATASNFYREERYEAEPYAGSLLIYRLPEEIARDFHAQAGALFDDLWCE